MITTEYTLPLEPNAFALRRASADLAKERDLLELELRLFPTAERTRGHRHRVHELNQTIEWLDYRADMREVW